LLKLSSGVINKRTSARKYRIPQESVNFVCLLLETDWNPDQISSALNKVGAAVSN
jgi:hypothetical protein